MRDSAENIAQNITGTTVDYLLGRTSPEGYKAQIDEIRALGCGRLAVRQELGDNVIEARFCEGPLLIQHDGERFPQPTVLAESPQGFVQIKLGLKAVEGSGVLPNFTIAPFIK